MTLPGELEKLGAILEAVATNAEQFATRADNYSPGEMRAAFVLYAEAVRSVRGYLCSIQKLAEVTP